MIANQQTTAIFGGDFDPDTFFIKLQIISTFKGTYFRRNGC
jgi:hypothetical protein